MQKGGEVRRLGPIRETASRRESAIKKLVFILAVAGIGVYAAITMIVSPPAFERPADRSGRKLAYERTISEIATAPTPNSAFMPASDQQQTAVQHAEDTGNSADPIGALAAQQSPPAESPLASAPEPNAGGNAWDAEVQTETPPEETIAEAEAQAAGRASAETASTYGTESRDEPPAQGVMPPRLSPDAQGGAALSQQVENDPDLQPQAEASNPVSPQGETALPEQQPEPEWVQVAVSGAKVQATASDDAPMLFAMPYGRRLRIVAHDGEWVQITDAQNKATGWMRIADLAPVADEVPPQVASRYEPEEGPGEWLQRQGGGVASIIRGVFGGW